MCLAAQRLSEAIAARRIRHPDDRDLNRHVLAAVPKTVGESWRFAKPRRKQLKIDAAIALAIAYSTMLAEPPPRGKGITFW
jgi:phage terminase large subunit-like protein